MIVVADTSPLNYLVLIDEVEVLAGIFGKVLIPKAVLDELQHARTPSKVREWAGDLPKWVEVCSVVPVENAVQTGLDKGEREAIQLAIELRIDTVLLDEADGRRAAEMLHLEVRGTLGILERAAALGMLNFRSALTRLELTSFRISPAIHAAFLNRNQ